MTVIECVARIEARLEAAGLFFGHGADHAADEAAWLVLTVAGRPEAGIDEVAGETLGADALARIDELVHERIATGRPLAYLLKEAWFAGLSFYVDERAIVPRSHLGEWIPDAYAPWVDARAVDSVLDLGTGCGCIAIATAVAIPHARVDAVDLSAEALEVARINAERHGVTDRLRLVEGDLYRPVAGERYDLIVSNPPYVSHTELAEMPREFRAEPSLAFGAGAEGLDVIRRILRGARECLEPGGSLIVEAGNAAPAVELRYPRVPFTWLSSASGETVVLLLTAEELERHAEALA